MPTRDLRHRGAGKTEPRQAGLGERTTADISQYVYGEDFIDTAYDKLLALMNSLISAMSDNYDPKISYAYRGHSRALIYLNAVTIELIQIDENITWPKYVLTFSLRIHSAYNGGTMDGLKNARLYNSVINKLNANKNLGDGYHLLSIESINQNMEFAESPTIGGEMELRIFAPVTYIQEG